VRTETIWSEGVALARGVLAEDDLFSERLVRPFDFEYPQSLGYYLVAAEADHSQKNIRAFWDWIMEEACGQRDNREATYKIDRPSTDQRAYAANVFSTTRNVSATRGQRA